MGADMGLKITGQNNRLLIVEKGKERELKEEITGLDIEISGDNNYVRIEYPQSFFNCRLKMFGNFNRFCKKESHGKTVGTLFYLSNSSKIEIGRNCIFNDGISVLAKEKKGVGITLGDEVLVATGCIIRTGDGHTLVNSGSRDPLNEPGDIRVGRHVWIGARSMLLKGAEIANNSIVGAMSLVNKKFGEKNVVIAGVPARIICRNADWDIRDYASYTEIED